MKSRISSLYPGIMMLFTVLLWVGSTFAAAPPSLKGDYAFTGEAGCLISPNGFDGNLKPKGDVFFIDSSSVQGVRTFNGDGTGTVEGTTITTTYGGTFASASSETFNFSFTYALQPDGTFTSDIVAGTYKGKVVSGPRAPQTFTIDNFPELVGYPSADNKTLTLATVSPTSPTVETHTFSNGDIEYVICHRSRVLIGVALPK